MQCPAFPPPFHASTDESESQLDHLEYFTLVGKMIGLALSSRSHMPARFSIPLLKKILQQPLSVEDLQGVDAVLYKSMVENTGSLDEDGLRRAGGR